MLKKSVVLGSIACGVSVGVVGYQTRERLLQEQRLIPTNYLAVFDEPEEPRKRAIVIGGGIAGLATASSLTEDYQFDVVVLDANAAGAGKECSRKSAGGMQKMNVRVDKESYVATLKQLLPFQDHFKFFHINYLRCISDPHWWRWMYSFTEASFSSHSEREAQMLDCTIKSIDVLNDQLRANAKLAREVGFSESGAFRLLQSSEEASAMRADPRWLPTLDVEPTCYVDAKHVAELLPWIPANLRKFGAVRQTQAARGNSEVYAAHVASHCNVIAGVQVLNFTVDPDSNNVIREIVTSEGRIQVPPGTAIVVAAGSHTPKILQRLGYYCPVYPLKGYNLLVDLPSDAVPDHIVSLGKLYFSRLGDQLRVASIGEFNGFHSIPDPAIDQLLREKAQEILPSELEKRIRSAPMVVGARPLVADGAIILGRLAKTNLFVNVGPGFNGWKMGPGCGQLLARMIAEGHVDYPELLPDNRVVYSPTFAAFSMIVSEMFHSD